MRGYQAWQAWREFSRNPKDLAGTVTQLQRTLRDVSRTSEKNLQGQRAKAAHVLSGGNDGRQRVRAGRQADVQKHLVLDSAVAEMSITDRFR